MDKVGPFNQIFRSSLQFSVNAGVLLCVGDALDDTDAFISSQPKESVGWAILALV